MASDILIVDDEADIRELVAGILQDEGHGTRTAADSDEALAAVVARRPNLVFLDIWLQGSRLDGLQLLDVLKQEHPELPVVMISGHGNIETAVSAIKRGAYDFIEKPFKADRLLLVAERTLEHSRLRREVREGLNGERLGDRRWFLKENEEYKAMFLDGALLDIVLPPQVALKVLDTAPPVRGGSDTAWKEAKLETGLAIMVPLFIAKGETVRVDTASRKYAGKQS